MCTEVRERVGRALCSFRCRYSDSFSFDSKKWRRKGSVWQKLKKTLWLLLICHSNTNSKLFLYLTTPTDFAQNSLTYFDAAVNDRSCHWMNQGPRSHSSSAGGSDQRKYSSIHWTMQQHTLNTHSWDRVELWSPYMLQLWKPHIIIALFKVHIGKVVQPCSDALWQREFPNDKLARGPDAQFPLCVCVFVCVCVCVCVFVFVFVCARERET